MFAKRSAILAAFLILAVAAAGCAGEKRQEEPQGETAEKVCGSVLDKPAAQALRRLAGSNRFQEDASLFNRYVHRDKFSASWAAGQFRHDSKSVVECHIYRTGDEKGKLFLGLMFTAQDVHPTKESRIKGGARGLKTYPIGAFAATDADGTAELYFPCTVQGKRGVYHYLTAGVVDGGFAYKSHAVGDDFMEIINSASRHLAAELDCGDEAKLPERVPRG